ncbi:uncharacterized protein LOC142631281 [Castanea sativa]|uniref:uncharacterized protein LOC142631281 n=1 Tax=Castanea sativa TaxID=21020 RepID=UPI003F64F9AF
MVIKSKQEGQHVDDLKEMFEILCQYRLRLNSDKCEFRVGSDRILGYLITERGIEVSPDQIEAVKRLRPSGNQKEVQKLIGMLWDEECDRAFQDLKDYLGRAPTLSALEPGENLYMYLFVSEHAASVVLLRDNGSQLLVYYISKMLVNAETSQVGDSAGLLRHQIQAKELSEGTSTCEFYCRVLAESCEHNLRDRSQAMEGVCGWASNAVGAGAGIVVITPEDLKLEHSFRLGFRASNNEAGYEALLAGLRVVMDLGAKEVEVYSDSLIVVSQVQGNFEAKDPRMIEYLWLAKQMMRNFAIVKIERIARGQNRHANSLVTLASSIAKEVPRLIRVELVPEPSIAARALIIQVTEAEKCKMDLIIYFISEDRAPKDEKKAARVRRTSARYWLSADRKLYRRSFEGPYL